jgi:aprataxin and PNK-like factor
MTEEERKDLIARAVEAKKKLEEELKATREKMEEREQELQRMQEEVCATVFAHSVVIQCEF